MESERKIDAVRKYVKDNKIEFPVLTDNDHRLWNSWRTTMWPTTILIGKDGKPRGKWEGELDWKGSREYRNVEAAIEKLRKERVPDEKPK
jgi:peroxiredoxin